MAYKTFLNYTPHPLIPHLAIDFKNEKLTVLNLFREQVELDFKVPESMSTFRKIWYQVTQSMMTQKTNIVLMSSDNYMFSLKYGTTGYRVTLDSRKEYVTRMWDGSGLQIGPRPITPFHILRCVNNNQSYKSALHDLQMNTTTVKRWCRS